MSSDSVERPQEIPNGEHGSPTGIDCSVCLCEIDSDTYAEYKAHTESANWIPSKICSECIEMLRQSQWKRFEELVAKADCRAALMRLCNAVPLTVHDSQSLVCPQHGEDCPQKGAAAVVWTPSRGEYVPILEGAKVGEEREKYVEHLRQFAELLEAEKKEEQAAHPK